MVTNGEFNTNIASWMASGSVGYSNFYSNGCAAFSEGGTPVTGVLSQDITVTSGATLTVTLNYGRRGMSGSTVGGLFEILNGTAIISSTTITAPDAPGTFITTNFTITAPATNLLIRFTDQTTQTHSKDFHFNTISVTEPASTLPIELTYFIITPNDEKKVELNWQTTSEINNDFFTIERSKNGTDWEERIQIDGAGNSSSSLNYSAIDSHPSLGISYYRLMQTDFNGQFEYADIRSVNIERQESSKIEIYPNPVNNQIKIYANSTELEDIAIYNTIGQNVTFLTQEIEKYGSKLVIDLSGLRSGIYYIKTNTTTNKVYKQ